MEDLDLYSQCYVVRRDKTCGNDVHCAAVVTYFEHVSEATSPGQHQSKYISSTFGQFLDGGKTTEKEWTIKDAMNGRLVLKSAEGLSYPKNVLVVRCRQEKTR